MRILLFCILAKFNARGKMLVLYFARCLIHLQLQSNFAQHTLKVRTESQQAEGQLSDNMAPSHPLKPSSKSLSIQRGALGYCLIALENCVQVYLKKKSLNMYTTECGDFLVKFHMQLLWYS